MVKCFVKWYYFLLLQGAYSFAFGCAYIYYDFNPVSLDTGLFCISLVLMPTNAFLFKDLRNNLLKGDDAMDRLAQIGIIIEDISSADKVNDILHDYAQYIVGRMGLPYKKYGVMIISVIIDAPNEKINALTGKLSMTPNVSAKAVFSKVGTN